MKKFLAILVAAVALLTSVQSAQAVVMHYSAAKIADLPGSWERYSMNIDLHHYDPYFDDPDALPIQWFTVYFGQTTDYGETYTQSDMFRNITAGSTPADWIPSTAEPDIVNSLPGFYSPSLDDPLKPGILPLERLGGFNVKFDMLAGATYDGLFFEAGNFETIFLPDSDDLNSTIEYYAYSVSGFTQTVPEPATFVLLGGGLVGLAFFRKNQMKP